MAVNHNKTQIVDVNDPGAKHLDIDGMRCVCVDTVRYLGHQSYVRTENCEDESFERRVETAWACFWKYDKGVFQNRSLNWKSKTKWLDQTVGATLLYSLNSFTYAAKQLLRIRSTTRSMTRRCFGFTWSPCFTISKYLKFLSNLMSNPNAEHAK